MGNDNIFYDEYYEFKGYRFIISRVDGNPSTVFSMSEADFHLKKDLVTWLDFLIKTNQWIPYAVWKDLFGLTEYDYIGLKEVKDMKLQYIETVTKIKDINIF